MPYLSTIDIDRQTASLVASAVPLVSICGRLSFGWLGDRYDKRWVTAAGYAIMCISGLLFSYITDIGTWVLVPFLILFGIGYGGPVPMLPALLREYFGRVRLGTIIGLVWGFAAVGSVAGPPLTGWVYDTFGSYQGAWLGLTAIVFLGVFSFITAPSISEYKADRLVNN
ncbi:MFS transporter [Chloroflexota bacterium]